MDYCFCPHSLKAFRAWARARYGTLDALNAEWDTKASSWDEVTPLTTYEIKANEKQALAAGRPENFAPWADHREFMDQTWAATLGRLRDIVHAVDPATPVGLEGLQMPSAWGGYDLWRLSRVVDWVEPYDIANSRAIFRSFMPAHAPILSTSFETDASAMRAKLWRLLLEGDRGVIFWDDNKNRAIDLAAPGLPLTDRGKAISSVLAEIKPLARKLMSFTPQDDRIAIHYSQASIRAHWMFDSREDGKTWPRRFSSYEATHSRYSQARDATVRIVEDLGLHSTFVSYEQIEKGELISGRYKVLLLPQSVAISAAEKKAIEAFVNSGGVVIADNMTATMDEHGKRLAKGQLDEMFRNHPDKATYLNQPPQKSQFANIFKRAGIVPGAAPIPGTRQWRYKQGQSEFLAIMRNQKSPDTTVTVELFKPAKVRNLRSGEDYGTTKRITATLDSSSPIILVLHQ